MSAARPAGCQSPRGRLRAAPGSDPRLVTATTRRVFIGLDRGPPLGVDDDTFYLYKRELT
jgi:hypothetical protein